MLRIDHKRYSKAQEVTTIEEGASPSTTVERRPDEEVDAAYVERYLSAREFFEDLGGTEVHNRRSGGVLVVKATRPDGLVIVRTIFTPVR